MLNSLKEIFDSGTIEINSGGDRVALHSHTPKEQGFFIQDLYEATRPAKSLEVGFAYGISTLFILEKCREFNAAFKSHVVIEPVSWGDAAIHNIRKEGLFEYVDIRGNRSDVVIPSMYLNNERIQWAYVDTTKVFDIVLQDFYFIDKILDVGGVIIIDDATTGGINLVARFINTLPHYQVAAKFEKQIEGPLFTAGERIFEGLVALLPFKKKFMNNYSFKTNRQLGIDYRCIAFKKVAEDKRNWDWQGTL